MLETLTSFSFQLIYIFTHMTISDVLDIGLVTVIIFVVFQALYQTRAIQLLRGMIIIAILGGALLVLLPLDTFTMLVRVILIAGVIAVPLLFQNELRRAILGVGQLRRRRQNGSHFERLKEALVSSTEQLSARKEGALIVLEGQTPLDDIIVTGIPLNAEIVTSELLQTIFHSKTPLHDGAVVLRGDSLIAASCILPVTIEKIGDTHMGTRHRAALGLSTRIPDALIIVVSEETGGLSVVWKGKLYQRLNSQDFVGWLDRFQDHGTGDNIPSWRWLQGGNIKSSISNLVVAIILAIVLWVTVVYQTNPPAQVAITGIPITTLGPAQGLLLLNELPKNVNVNVRTTQDRAEKLTNSSVRAELNLLNLTPGIHQALVEVSAPDPFTQLLDIQPASVSVEIEPETSNVLTPSVILHNIDSLPLGYSVGEALLSPNSISIQGPKPLVDTVKQAKIDIKLDGQRTDIQQTIIPVLSGVDGKPIDNILPTPKEVLVTIPILRTFFTRELGIQADLIEDSLEKGYEIRRIEITPPVVTLTGSSIALDEAGDFLVTAPISLTGITNDIFMDVPLVVPETTTPLNDLGETVNSVTVDLKISPNIEYYVLEREIADRNLSPGLSVKINPGRTTILLIGPRPLIDQIKQNPDLVAVFIDLQELAPGEYSIAVNYEVPPGVEARVFPSEAQVVID